MALKRAVLKRNILKQHQELGFNSNVFLDISFYSLIAYFKKLGVFSWFLLSGKSPLELWILFKVQFREKLYACDMNKKGEISVNLEKFED